MEHRNGSKCRVTYVRVRISGVRCHGVVVALCLFTPLPWSPILFAYGNDVQGDFNVIHFIYQTRFHRTQFDFVDAFEAVIGLPGYVGFLLALATFS